MKGSNIKGLCIKIINSPKFCFKPLKNIKEKFWRLREFLCLVNEDIVV